MAMLATRAKDPTDCIFGVSPDGKVVHFTLSSAPHLLVAGTTGSGKSVLMNQLNITMMQHSSPEELKFIIIDPKKVEFAKYKDSPYMLINPITEVSDAYEAVVYATIVMDERYGQFTEAGVKNIKDYNEWAEKNNEEKLPYIVIVIDEFSDLIMQHREVEDPIVRIGQKARAAGIHAIIATQSPRATVITGLIKANFPSRLSLMVASSLESGIILDENGGESLQPHGDMLIKMNGGRPIRAQGSFISDKEIDNIFDYQRKNYPKPNFVDYKKVVQEFTDNKENEKSASDVKSSNIGGFASPKKGNVNKSVDQEEQSPFQKKRKFQEENTGVKAPSLKRLREEKLAKLAELMGEEPSSQVEGKSSDDVKIVRKTDDEMLEEAKALAKESGISGNEMSVPFLQRKFVIGYNRAVELRERLEKEMIEENYNQENLDSGKPKIESKSKKEEVSNKGNTKKSISLLMQRNVKKKN